MSRLNEPWWGQGGENGGAREERGERESLERRGEGKMWGREQENNQGKDSQENTSTWQGCTGKESWGKGIEAPGLESFCSKQDEKSREEPKAEEPCFAMLIGTTVGLLSRVSLGPDSCELLNSDTGN